MIKIKRAYDKPGKEDGFRILIDRLWPRGIKKADAKVDLWLKDAAPSGELRKWFGHDPDKWNDFKKRYFAELDSNGESVKAIKDRAKKGTVTLLYGSKEERYNNAVALKEYLKRRAGAKTA